MPAALLRALGPSEEHTKTHRSSQRYALDKINFGTVSRAIALFETLALLTGFLNHMLGSPFPEGWTGLRGLWQVGTDLAGVVSKGGVMWQSIGFLVITTVLGTFTEMPKVRKQTHESPGVERSGEAGGWRNFRGSQLTV